MHYICAVEYTSGYRLRLKFEDCIVRAVDLERHLDGEIFEPLKDIRRFRTARLNPDLDTVVWDNGADMSPDFLYAIGTPVQERAGTACAVAEEHVSYGKNGEISTLSNGNRYKKQENVSARSGPAEAGKQEGIHH